MMHTVGELFISVQSPYIICSNIKHKHICMLGSNILFSYKQVSPLSRSLLETFLQLLSQLLHFSENNSKIKERQDLRIKRQDPEERFTRYIIFEKKSTKSAVEILLCIKKPNLLETYILTYILKSDNWNFDWLPIYQCFHILTLATNLSPFLMLVLETQKLFVSVSLFKLTALNVF